MVGSCIGFTLSTLVTLAHFSHFSHFFSGQQHLPEINAVPPHPVPDGHAIDTQNPRCHGLVSVALPESLNERDFFCRLLKVRRETACFRNKRVWQLLQINDSCFCNYKGVLQSAFQLPALMLEKIVYLLSFGYGNLVRSNFFSGAIVSFFVASWIS